MKSAIINSAVLPWARERSGIGVYTLSKKIAVAVKTIRRWEKGLEQPSFAQARKLADALHVPFGYLYLQEPPMEEKELPDMRVAWEQMPYSLNLQEVMGCFLYKQEWYKDYLTKYPLKKLEFIGQFDAGDQCEAIVSDIERNLGFERIVLFKKNSARAVLAQLVEYSEQTGINVARVKRSGKGPDRKLDTNEFCGIVIADNYAPFILLNGNETEYRQINNMITGLVFLFMGKSGVFGSYIYEALCNSSTKDQYFNRTVWNVCKTMLDQTSDSINQKEMKRQDNPDPYLKTVESNGRNFTDAVLSSVANQEILIREGAVLLGVGIADLLNLTELRKTSCPKLGS